MSKQKKIKTVKKTKYTIHKYSYKDEGNRFYLHREIFEEKNGIIWPNAINDEIILSCDTESEVMLYLSLLGISKDDFAHITSHDSSLLKVVIDMYETDYI